MASQEAQYTLVLKDQHFEVRAYAAHIVAQTVMQGRFANAGNKAFSRLFKQYITGNNRARQSISMTSPVAQQAGSQKIAMTSPKGQQQVDDDWVISFIMPADAVLETLPEPKDP